MSEASEERSGQTRTRGGRPPRLTPVPDVVEPRGAGPLSTTPPQTVSVLPAEVDLQIYEGDDFYLDVQVTDLNGNPIDVTNSQPLSQIRASTSAPSQLCAFTITIDGSVTGLLHLHLAASDSNNLPTECVWDLQLSAPSVTTIAAGTVTVTPQVTQ